jgi:hypothetical protein
MQHTKWIVVQGMMTVEQAKALSSAIGVGLDEEGLGEHLAFVADVGNKLDESIAHIENQGFAGSGIVIEGNMHLPRLAEPHTYQDEQDRANGVESEPLAS